jgi:hypothetical protein
LAGGTTRIALGTVAIHRLYGASTTNRDFDILQQQYRIIEGRVKTNLREMNIPEALYDSMMQISSQTTHTLSWSELKAFGLSGQDPVAEDLENSIEATKYGLTKTEYLRRNAQAFEACRYILHIENYTAQQYSECYESLLRGER